MPNQLQNQGRRSQARHQRPRRGGHTSGCGINPAAAGLHHVPHSREDRPESISRDCSKQRPALQGKLLSATLYGWAMRSQVANRTRTEFRDLRTHVRRAMPILRHPDQLFARAGEYKLRSACMNWSTVQPTTGASTRVTLTHRRLAALATPNEWSPYGSPSSRDGRHEATAPRKHSEAHSHSVH